MDNFEKASRLKLRFETSAGHLATEDLWELSLTSLDNLAQNVNKQLKNEEEESFLPSKSSKSPTYNTLRLNILKYVIGVKLEEQEAKKSRAEKLAALANLKELAMVKTNEQLASKSLKDIEKKISELELQLA